MRKAFSKEQMSVKAKSAFIMFCSDMEEIKQMLKVNLCEQACEKLAQIHKQAQFKVIRNKALFYVMRAAAFEDLQMFDEAAACFAEGKKRVTTEVSTLEAGEAKFAERLAAHQKAEHEQVNELLFSPQDEDASVAKTLTFDEAEEEDTFKEIEAPVLHTSMAADLFEDIEEPQRRSTTDPCLLDLLGCDSPAPPPCPDSNIEEASAVSFSDPEEEDAEAEAEVSPAPLGSTIMMGKVSASKKEQTSMGAPFFMSPVRRSARKMTVSPGSKMEKILEENACSYKPNSALAGSMHVDDSKPFSALNATETLKSAFEDDMTLHAALDCMDDNELVSPMKMPQFPGIDLGLGSYLISPHVSKTSTPLRRSSRIATAPDSLSR